MMKFVAKLFAVQGQSSVAGRKTRLEAESLESRDVPTSGISLSNAGVIEIQGGATADTASVRIDTMGTVNPLDDRVTVRLLSVAGVTGVFPNIQVTPAQDVTKSFALSRLVPVNGSLQLQANVKSMEFHGDDGNDSFTNLTSLDSIAFGNAGFDYLVGGSGSDDLRGGIGNDILKGNDGNDFLFGEGGIDYLDGGNGADNLDGGRDAFSDIDTLIGGSGADIFVNYLPTDGLMDAFLDYGADNGDKFNYMVPF